MRFPFSFWLVAACSLVPLSGLAQAAAPSFIYETTLEFFGTGDFDGDGRQDVVILDKESGKYRLGYQTSPGVLVWVDCRPSGIRAVTGFSIGKLLATNSDALVLTSPDANQLSIISAASTSATSKPLLVPFNAAVGPQSLIAIDVGGSGNTGLADLYVSSIYNSPDANLATLVRNDGAEFPKVTESVLPAPGVHGNRIVFKGGQPELASVIFHDDKGDVLRVENLSSGQIVDALSITGLPAGSDYAVGAFGGSSTLQFFVYQPGEKRLSVRPVESVAGKLQWAKEQSFELDQPIRRIITLQDKTKPKLFVIFGKGEKGGVFNFDGLKAPTLVQEIVATNELLTCAASLPDELIAFSHSANGKFSTRYQSYKTSGASYKFSAFGGLPSLADNDNITIPDIREHIATIPAATSEAEMKPYTNTIPGTQVTYAMVPIPGGEFVMGSPDSEPNRKPDEGPQHKVSLAPFWMGQCEVTWNEYELFMYPDEEQRTRATIRTDPEGDKLADAVTHPSKPYVEMSFGMGKEGFPAIAMTQHGANKYCQWLSAKTGHFYRLPTEAEWEYAARAGTTTTYFFGNDASKLVEYAWFEQNSDFKYQKVRKKKPNPWGLYDIYGNVVEWVLDQYDPNFYAQCASASVSVEPWNRATKPYPHAVRGGSWDDEPPACRNAARRGSDRAWKMQDPQLPKSIWYHSDAQWVGFRIVRPLKVPSLEQMQKYWTSGVERD